ncbi:MAG: hypothetical protein JSW65_06440 [Candidatus Bipolaricaulota bacterium]|nr:MAG: hypothetical protein JSW65_06440 [Candidatus Bipolaricaulota bacterium]
MAEILIQRDENSRIISVVVRDLGAASDAITGVDRFLRAVVAAMNDYLHVHAEVQVGDEWHLEIDRADQHLSREIDAILETLLIGLNMLAEEYPADLALRESGLGVQV